MLINKSGAMLVIGRIKIRTGECVPGIALTAGEKKTVEAYKKVGYLFEEAKAETPKAEVETPKAEVKAKAEAKVEVKAEKQK